MMKNANGMIITGAENLHKQAWKPITEAENEETETSMIGIGQG